MAVYLGNGGMVTLSRDTGTYWLRTELDRSDVNVGMRRFSVNFYSTNNLNQAQVADSILNFITGDRVEIRTVEVDGTRPPLQLIPDWTDPAITRFVYVDPAGGMRLYDDFSDALEGSYEKAIELNDPPAPQLIEMRTRNSVLTRPLAEVKSYEITTSRDSIDTTVLNDNYRQQYDNGLIQGQGRVVCHWEHAVKLCDENLKDCERTPEVSMYLAQLLLRLDQGSDFKGYFWLYRDPENDDNSIWYEPEKCIVTNCVIEVSPEAIIETTIEFVCSGRIQLKQGITPSRLLLEGTPRAQEGLVLDEFLESPVALANKNEDVGP